MNVENLTESEIRSKIAYLENGIHRSIMNLGTEKFCVNRIERVKVLKSYLDK